MSIPGWIYFFIGAITAWIMLDDTQTKGYRPTDWFHLVFNIMRIIILWPLVLFVEKIMEWLKREPKVTVMIQVIEDEKTEGVFKGHWQLDNNTFPIPATGVSETR